MTSTDSTVDGAPLLATKLHPPRRRAPLETVVATRADPPLPLASLRADGDLLEIRAADLRFTAGEAAAYLNGAMDLTLTAADVEVLEARTEGWIAALQLAALSMQGRRDPASFINEFAGDDRFILDYLADEVLERQTAPVRDFLLHTSFLSRLTGPLCAAAGLIGLAHWWRGDLDGTRERYIESVACFESGDFLPDAMGCSLALADIQITQGRLQEAQRTFESALRHTAADPGLRGAADMHVGLSLLAVERNDLDTAADHLGSSAELGEHMGLPQRPYRWRVATARLHEARGDLDKALELLTEAEARYHTGYSPSVRPVTALTARIEVERGDLDAGARWADAHGLSAGFSPPPTRGTVSAAPSRSSCSSPSPSRQQATTPLPPFSWRRRLFGPSPRASSGRSSTPLRP